MAELFWPHYPAHPEHKVLESKFDKKNGYAVLPASVGAYDVEEDKYGERWLVKRSTDTLLMNTRHSLFICSDENTPIGRCEVKSIVAGTSTTPHYVVVRRSYLIRTTQQEQDWIVYLTHNRMRSHSDWNRYISDCMSYVEGWPIRYDRDFYTADFRPGARSFPSRAVGWALMLDEIAEALPHGSGIDDKWHLKVQKNGNIVCSNSFHHMDGESGMYTHWSNFTVLLKHEAGSYNYKLGQVRGMGSYDDNEFIAEQVYYCIKGEPWYVGD